MDDLYDNLDNYNEEATIAELREENKELKVKLEEYAFTLDKLQNEFNMLASEHKKLEQNYSSLLKTAKSEIERKSQIITKLNIEKDNMVLSAIQNQNTKLTLRRKEPRKYPNSEAYNERCNNSPSEVTRANSNTQTRLLDLVNSTQGDKKCTKNIEVKENVMFKDEAVISTTARISRRRKSMPVFSMDSAILTDEDEIKSTESAKELISCQFTARKHTDRFLHEKPVEERIFGQYISSKESQRSRNSNPYSRERSKEKYDSNQRHGRIFHSDNRKGSLEVHRVSPGREKGSLDRKRFSPNRRRYSPDGRRVSAERRKNSLERRRLSPERRRFSPERRIISLERKRISPEWRRFSPERSRRETRANNEDLREKKHDRNRKFIERSHNQDFDRPKSLTQDKYPLKHKLTDLEDSKIKRMRRDQQYEEDRWRNDRDSEGFQSSPQSLIFEYLNNMSCQSPEQTFLDGHTQAPREIKLTATMKLDDPRISSKKYVMMSHKGKPELISVQNSNTDIKIIDTRAWDMIKRMKLPDALLQKPPSIASPLNLFKKSVPPALDSNNPQATDLDMLESIKKKDSPELILHKQLTDKPEPVLKQLTNKPLNKQLSDKLESEIQCIDKTEPVLNKQLTDIPKPVANINIPKTLSYDLIDKIYTDICIPDEPEPVLKKQLTDKLEPVSNILNPKTLSNNLIDEIYMDIDNPLSNISIESGEICNDEENKNTIQNTEKSTHEKTKQPGSTKLDGNYKIPKKRKTPPTKPRNHIELHISDKQKDNQIPNTKDMSPVDKKRVNEIHDNRDTREIRKVTKTNIKQRTDPAKNVNNILICSSDNPCDFRNNITTKDIEDDLQLSDDATDNTDAQLTKPVMFLREKKKSDAKNAGHKLEVHKSLLTDQAKIELDTIDRSKDNQDFTDRKKSLEAKLKETAKDSKKPKTKKKSPKLKVTKESFENKDNFISLDKLTNELHKNNDTQPSLDRQVKQNENKSEKYHINTSESVYKESKVNEPEQPHEKLAKNKPNQLKEFPEIQEHIALINQPDKEKETKLNKIENKTKFSELFGDSSSLVCPEDLGLVPTVVPSNNLAYFEDAQDAMDMDTLQAAIAITTLKKTDDKTQENKSEVHFYKGIENTTLITSEKNYKSLPVFTVPSEYQNLQPVILTNENNVTNSIVISSGIQSQCVERTEAYPMTNGTETKLHVMQCVKPLYIQDLAVQALATSTPQKICDQNILPEPDPTQNSKREPNESQECVNKTSTTDHSENTDTSQTIHTDEPDLKLFVTRRRKVKRK